MSGISTHLRYDECASMQDVAQTTSRFRNYDFLIDKFENRKSSNTGAKCDGKNPHIECGSCKVNDASMDNTRDQSLRYRLDAEGDLLGLTRQNTLCDSGKYVPCNYKGDASSCAMWKTIAEPRLCDRSIVPTNMKPYASAFSYK